jgi:hypothetical protein
MPNRTGPQLTRRSVNSVLLAAASGSLFAAGGARTEERASAPRPFRVDIPQARIDRILARVRESE